MIWTSTRFAPNRADRLHEISCCSGPCVVAHQPTCWRRPGAPAVRLGGDAEPSMLVHVGERRSRTVTTRRLKAPSAPAMGKAYMHTRALARTHAHTHPRTHARTSRHAHAHAHARTHRPTHTHSHTQTHARTNIICRADGWLAAQGDAAMT